jgi:branched-chain amino acid transport system substrate-binding protein
VTVITAPAGGATAIFGSDLARVLDDDATIRVLPVLGKGPVRNVVDILYLKSIDIMSAIPPTAALKRTFLNRRSGP